MLFGYARTSTVEQVAGLEAQEVAIAATVQQDCEGAGVIGGPARSACRCPGLRAGGRHTGCVTDRPLGPRPAGSLHPGIARVKFRVCFLPKCLK